MSSAAIFEFLFGTLKVKYPLTLYIQSKQYGPKILPDKTELMDISKSELEDRIYCEFIDISIWMGLRWPKLISTLLKFNNSFIFFSFSKFI